MKTVLSFTNSGLHENRWSRFLIHSLFALLLVVSVSSCGAIKPVEDPEKENDYSLHSFSFDASINGAAGMTSSSLVRINPKSNLIYFTVNEGSDLTKLIPTVTSGEGTRIYINGAPVESGKSVVDFSETSTLVLESEDGRINKYLICGKTGNRAIDDAVYNLMIRYDIPGVSISANVDEELAYSYGYGFANTVTKERVTPNHLFRLASISKSQTALCIMTLVEQGKLKLSDRLFGEGGIFEEELGTDLVDGAENVTVQNMLEHASGWKGEHIFSNYINGSAVLRGKDVLGRMKYVVQNVPLTYQPGTRYSYYNMGYGLLGEVVKKISGKEYEDFLREDVYAKAGVKDIWCGGDQFHRRENEVVYYSQDGRDGYGNDMELIQSLGGLIASGPELMKVMASIDYGTKVPDILSKETLDVMYTPSVASPGQYSKGWRTNHTVFTNWENYHGGNLAGTATLWYRSTDGTAAVILCNSRNYESYFDTALFDVLAVIQKNVKNL